LGILAILVRSDFAHQTGIRGKPLLSDNLYPTTKELCKFDDGMRKRFLSVDGLMQLATPAAKRQRSEANPLPHAVKAWTRKIAG